MSAPGYPWHVSLVTSRVGGNLIYFIGLLVSLLFSASAFGAGFKDEGAIEYQWVQPSSLQTAMARSGDGLIVSATTSKFLFTMPNTFEAIRFKLDGTRDMSFGTGGELAVPLKGQSLYARTRTALSGKLIFLGVTRAGMTEDFDITLYRASANGLTDPGFGRGGAVRLDFNFGTEDLPIEVIPLPGDEMLLACASTDQVVVRNLVLKLNADGGIDPFFGHNGAIDIPLPRGATVQFVFPGPAGTLVVFASSPAGALFSTRFFLDGKPDPTYGKGGTAEYDFSAQLVEGWRDVVPVGTGGYVALGASPIDSKDRAFLVRLDDLGAPDPAFGKAGVVTARDENDKMNGMKTIRPVDGGAFMSLGTYENHLVFAKFAADGTLDSTFGTAGIAERSFVDRTFTLPLTLIPDGTDWIAEATFSQPKPGVVLTRLDAKGTFLGPTREVFR